MKWGEKERTDYLLKKIIELEERLEYLIEIEEIERDFSIHIIFSDIKTMFRERLDKCN